MKLLEKKQRQAALRETKTCPRHQKSFHWHHFEASPTQPSQPFRKRALGTTKKPHRSQKQIIKKNRYG